MERAAVEVRAASEAMMLRCGAKCVERLDARLVGNGRVAIGTRTCNRLLRSCIGSG
jgi:hypothetical protein